MQKKNVWYIRSCICAHNQILNVALNISGCLTRYFTKFFILVFLIWPWIKVLFRILMKQCKQWLFWAADKISYWFDVTQEYPHFKHSLCQKSLEYTDCIPWRGLKPHWKGCPRYNAKLHLIVRLQFQSYAECGVPLHYYYFQGHSDPLC